ncbi:MAG: AbrB/MazE/SpoVT family DNA-binding domain-containing protein [Ilumatobacteraceae bacterium]
MRVTEKGQITIPKDIRDELGIGGGTEVVIELDGEKVVVRKADRPVRGQRITDRLRGRGDITMSTDEIMALTRGE